MKKRTTSANVGTIRAMVSLVPSEDRGIAEMYVNELEFMADTLTMLKADVAENGPVELFKNGSQEMRRESPALKSYNTTIQRAAIIARQLVALVPEGEAKDDAADDLNDFIDAAPLV